MDTSTVITMNRIHRENTCDTCKYLGSCTELGVDMYYCEEVETFVVANGKTIQGIEDIETSEKKFFEQSPALKAIRTKARLLGYKATEYPREEE